MPVKVLLYILVWLWLFVPASRAQQYLFARYTPKNGLVNSRTRFLYQDSKGRLYISTFGGLSVYDGARFTNYTTDDGLITNLVNDIVEMGDDSLWIIPNGKALHCLVHGIIRNIKTSDNFYPVINQLIKCPDGYYYAISDEGLFRLEKDRFVKIPLTDETGKQPNYYLTKAIEWNRQLFILTDPSLGAPWTGALLVYNLDTRKLLITAKPAAFYSLVRSPSNDILVGTTTGIRKIDLPALQHNEIRLLPLPPPYQAASSIPPYYMFFDRSNNLWISAETKVIKIGREGKEQLFNTASGLPAGSNNSIFEDSESNIWFANTQNGIAKLVNQRVQLFARQQPGFTVTDLSATAGSDSVWFYDGSRHKLLLSTKKGQEIIYGTGPLPSNGQIIIGKNAFLISTNKIYKLQFLPGRRFKASLLYQDTVDINGHPCFDRKDNLVIPSLKLTVLLSGGKIIQQPLNYLSDQAAIDKYNRVWTATRSDILSVFAIDASGTHPALRPLATWSKEQPAISPRSITVDTMGRVWIGTRDRGLYCLFFDGLRLVSWKQLTIKNGLSENFVNYLNCDADNNIWACTPTGLDKICCDNGHFTIENMNPDKDISQSVYKVLPSGDGVNWALASGDYMKITRSDEKKDNYRPHVLFSEVLVGNKPVTDWMQHPLSLPHDHNDLSFFIGVPSFTDESQTRFTYLLEGSNDPQWSPPSIQSTINFAGLPPGKYTLKVKAQFLTGRYPDQVAAYPFVILPPWWQKSWFRISVLGLLAALTILGIRMYTSSRLEIQRIALEKKQAIEKERTRIATDMHDDLGAGLSRIKFLSETIGIKKQQQLPIEEEISGIREYSHEMIDKMGEIVWALNERNDSLSDLLSYTRSYAAGYLLQAGIHCTVEAPGDLPSRFVSGEFRRNVYLTIKEALHNIIKHAQAENVWLDMKIHRDLTITIRDDGIGFDKDRIRPFANGLQNMERRIKDIGGTLVILHGHGTTIQLSVPL